MSIHGFLEGGASLFKLISIELFDFLSFQHCLVDFSRPGLYLISGCDEMGKDSNGSGKSTILNGISWALFGRTLKGVQGKDVIRWGTKNCKAILKLIDKEHTYEIERTIDGLSFLVDERFVEGHRTDVQSTIHATFKTDFYSFSRSTSFSQSQVEFLASSTDSDKKRLFKDILGLSRLDRLYERIKTRYDTTTKEAEKLENESSRIEYMLSSIEKKFLETEELQVNFESDKRGKIERYKQQKLLSKPGDKTIIHQDIGVAEGKMEEFKDTESEYQLASDMRNKIIYQQERNLKDIDELEDLIVKSEKLRSKCYICGSIVTKKKKELHITELSEKVDGLRSLNNKMEDERGILTKTLIKISEKISEREKWKSTLEMLNRNLAATVGAWIKYEDLCIFIDSKIEEVSHDNPYSNILSNLSRDIDHSRNDLLHSKEEYGRIQKRLDTLAFLKWTLSKEGVASFIIEKAFGRLQYLCNKYLSSLSHSLFQIEITPQRELKSGALKEEIDIKILMGDKKTQYWNLSDGQRQRLNVALLLSLNKLCKENNINSFDFLLLDEVIDISLDELGQEDVMNLLREYLRECPQIIVISHKDKIKSEFDYNIHVYRNKEGVSEI